MEAHDDLLGGNPSGPQVLLHRQGATPGGIAVGQAIATAVGVAVELEAIDAGVGLDEVENDVELGLGQRLQLRAVREAQLGLADLVEVNRQQARRALEVVVVGLIETNRQQTHFQAVATLQGAVTHQRAAPLHQPGEQTPGLLLVAVERHLAAANRQRPQVDVATPRLPGCRRRQQGRRTRTQPALAHREAESRLLAGAAHELAAAEVRDGLAEATLELITLDLPLHFLHARLECDGRSRHAPRQAGEQAEQEGRGSAQDRLRREKRLSQPISAAPEQT